MCKVLILFLILMIISHNGNYLEDEDIEIFDAPKEYLITNTFLRRNSRFPGQHFENNIEPKIIDLRHKISKEVLEEIKNSEISYLINLDDEDTKEMRGFFAN